jgi:hypothetical protein
VKFGELLKAPWLWPVYFKFITQTVVFDEIVSESDSMRTHGVPSTIAVVPNVLVVEIGDCLISFFSHCSRAQRCSSSVVSLVAHTTIRLVRK